MNSNGLPLDFGSGGAQSAVAVADEIPLTVRQAAVFLGVSPQTVYLWVERKQIPHLRVMGRNIRFLKSELEPFRATSNRRWGMARPSKHDGVVYQTKRQQSLVDALPGSRAAGAIWNQPTQKTGMRRNGKLRERLHARDDKHAGDRAQGRATLISELGGVFPGELLQAANSRREDARGQHAGDEASEECLRDSQVDRPHRRRNRAVSAARLQDTGARQDRRRCFENLSC